MMLIAPTRADIDAQLELLKPALNRMPNPKNEFLDICDAVKNREASFYQFKVKDKGVLRFVGQARETDYFIWALAGNGLVHVAPEIIKRVRSCGYQSITINTFKVGVVAMLGRIGFIEKERLEHDGVNEFVMHLTL
jgi:hypothetical protein